MLWDEKRIHAVLLLGKIPSSKCPLDLTIFFTFSLYRWSYSVSQMIRSTKVQFLLKNSKPYEVELKWWKATKKVKWELVFAVPSWYFEFQMRYFLLKNAVHCFNREESSECSKDNSGRRINIKKRRKVWANSQELNRKVNRIQKLSALISSHFIIVQV
jgi:hypothetical protein